MKNVLIILSCGILDTIYIRCVFIIKWGIITFSNFIQLNSINFEPYVILPDCLGGKFPLMYFAYLSSPLAVNMLGRIYNNKRVEEVVIYHYVYIHCNRICI